MQRVYCFNLQVSIKGEAEDNLIALTGLYIDEGKHCTHEPPSAKKGKICIPRFY